MLKKIILVCMCLITLAAVGIYFLLRPANYVAKVGKYIIMPSEFYVYLYEQKIRFEELGEKDIWEIDFDENNSAESIAKQNALEINIMVKLTASKALQFGIQADTNDTDNAKIWAEDAFVALGENITAKTGITTDILYKIYIENLLYSKIFEEITGNFILNENDFSIFFGKYLEEKESIEDKDTSYEELRQEAQNNYVRQKKNELYQAEYAKWLTEVSVLQNKNIYDEITIKNLE